MKGQRSPTLIVVSGPAGTGKTTLAHRLAPELGGPAICRDEIKEGLVFGRADFEAAIDDELTRDASSLFFDVVGLLVGRGVTVVAEAAFQHHVWAPNLEPLREAADIVVVQCHADLAVARARLAERANTRPAHADAAVMARGDEYSTSFRRLAIDVPTITVDTTDGYDPPLADVVAYARLPGLG
ncbi:MAG TPA: AAA family ATPase [Acidimicrobiia bacterium]